MSTANSNLVQCGICRDESGFSEVYCDISNGDMICDFGGAMGAQIVSGIPGFSKVIQMPSADELPDQQETLDRNPTLRGIAFVEGGMVMIYESKADIFIKGATASPAQSCSVEWYDYTGVIN